MKSQSTLCFALIFFSLWCNSDEMQVITEHSPPGEYKDESGRVTGPTAEMVRELMGRLKLSDEIEIYPWKRAYNLLLQGPNVALFETTRTKDRENLFKWVGPIKRVRWGFYARQNSEISINSLKDAMDVNKICIYAGDAKGQFLKNQGFSNLHQPTRSIQCLKMLMNSRVSLWVTSDLATASIFKEAGVDTSEIKMLYGFASKYLYIALSNDVTDDVVNLWQEKLDQMKVDGSLANYYQGTYQDDLIRDISQLEKPVFPWKVTQ